MGHAPGLGARQPAAPRPGPGLAAPNRHVDLEPGSLARRRATSARAAGCARPPRQHLLALVASRPLRHELPDYLPPREGVDSFRAALATAHAAGSHAMVYMNQRLWCTGTPSWTAEGAASWAVKERDGRVREEVYNVFDPQPCATMDVTTSFWRAKYAGIADTVLDGYGVDGIYMDQAVQSLVCWDPTHGHPVGGGNYWMGGFRALATQIRAAVQPGRPVLLAGEGAGEPWLPELDLMLTLQVSQERYTDPGSGWEPIPFFQAVYHAYGVTYGNYSSL